MGKLQKSRKRKKLKQTSDVSEEIDEDEETKILNSFYINDLQTVKKAFAQNNCGTAIRAFLNENEIAGADKFNLENRETLETILAPKNIPLGRWASDDNKYQSLMQQAAINLALNKPKQNGKMFSVNGPPGTGKTTMLRDIIAALIVERAMCLAKFNNPHDAFESVEEIPLSNGKSVNLYQPDSQITGYEMVVASSNNSAVQNVTQEIPDKGSISEGHLNEAKYFHEVAENVFNKNKFVQPWGLIAAVLGNKGNRNEFKERFWFDEPNEEEPYRQSIKSYLRQNENVAKMPDWKQVKEVFLDLYEQVSQIIQRRQTYFEAVKTERQLTTELSKINKELQIISRKITETENKAEIFARNLQLLSEERLDILENIKAVASSKPSKFWLFVSFIYIHPDVEKYNQRMDSAQTELDEINKKVAICKKEAKINQEKHRLQKREFQVTKQKQSAVIESLHKIEKSISEGKNDIGTEAFADNDWWEKDENELQKRTPWLDEKLNYLRSRLFLQAMKLHEVFVRMARKKILDNLRLWTEMVGGDTAVVSSEQAVYLWQTFFLVVPVISTTFASLGRMFSNLGRESIGWLLVDEAGQATPQAAVGGIWRAKQAIVVGDPLQIEPVVGLDDTVVEQVRKFYEIESQWSLKTASVQTLADRANHFGAYLENDNSKIWVGCPLRVHRRCLNPMFDIANKIAYGGKMVYATSSPENITLNFKSRWIHSPGNCTKGHWTDELWNDVKSLLLAETENSKSGLPELFIISPFRDVARELKKLVVKNKSEWLVKQKISQKDLRIWAAKSIGTVHTFQGKEEETVIFVLGADENSKSSAQWAAGKPNILNVAVTRAKFAIYIVGNKNVWGNLSNFRTAFQELKENEKNNGILEM